MTTNTTNHSFGKPAIGATQGWGTTLNTNFDNLDTDVEIRDTDANKSNYDPKSGAMFRATDTGAIYRGDGNNWNLLDIEVDKLTAGNGTFVANSGGPVEVNTDLQIPTGNYIQDDNGDHRIAFNSGQTLVNDQGGNTGLVLTGGSRYGFNISGERWDIYDSQAGHRAIEMDSVSSGVNTFTLTNAKLDLGGNDIDLNGSSGQQINLNDGGSFTTFNGDSFFQVGTDSNWTIKASGSGQRFRYDDTADEVKVFGASADPGASSSPALVIGDSGAGFYIDSNGDIVGVDESGNTAVLT